MQIGEICNRKVVVTGRETPVTEAAKLMREHHVGTLVILQDADSARRTPAGIVTDRDIVVEIVATELDPKTITVGDIMVPELVTAKESEGLLETMEIMRHNGVRRLPVLGNEGQLAGIVSIDDLLEILAEQITGLTGIVAREQARETRSRR
jgi:CBS domain-containing protein